MASGVFCLDCYCGLGSCYVSGPWTNKVNVIVIVPIALASTIKPRLCNFVKKRPTHAIIAPQFEEVIGHTNLK